MKLVEYIRNDKNSLFNSILFLILGIILFTNPGGVLKFISWIVGSILIIVGICNILSYRKTLKKLNIELKSKLISGIILIILGCVTSIIATFIETTIRLIIAAWIIYNGVIKLMAALADQKDKNKFIINLVISILTILCGLYVALATNLVFTFIGLFIMIYSILDIINFVVNKSNV